MHKKVYLGRRRRLFVDRKPVSVGKNKTGSKTNFVFGKSLNYTYC